MSAHSVWGYYKFINNNLIIYLLDVFCNEFSLSLKVLFDIQVKEVCILCSLWSTEYTTD